MTETMKWPYYNLKFLVTPVGMGEDCFVRYFLVNSTGLAAA